MKRVGIIKRRIATCLIFLMCINSFAAIVSDNDGSAFITKAEFDSLKNNFQSQIDNYNQSIDSKIDGAIASYLAGISVSQSAEIESLLYKCSQRKEIKWKKGWVFPTTQIGNKYMRGLFQGLVYGTVYTDKNGNKFGCDYQFDIYDHGHGNSIGMYTYGSTNSIYVAYNEFNQDPNVYYAQTNSFRTSIPYATLYGSTQSSWSRLGITSTSSVTTRYAKTAFEKSASDKTTGSKQYNVNVTTTVKPATPSNWSYTRQLGENYNVGFNDTMSYSAPNIGNLAFLSANQVSGQCYAIKQEEDNVVDWEHPKQKIYSTDCEVDNGDGTTTSYSGTWYGYQQLVASDPSAKKDQSKYAVRVTYMSDDSKMPSKLMETPVYYCVYDHKSVVNDVDKYVDYDFSNATGEIVYYYAGVPVLKNTSGKKGKLKFTLKVKGSNTNVATYCFKKSAFTNSDTLDASDITIYSDATLTTPVTTFNINSTSWTSKTYYCSLDRDEMVWFKAMPYNNSQNVYVACDEPTYEIAYE